MGRTFTVVDLFSGGGGMSYGFHAHPSFRVVGAADAQLGKPSSRRGSLGCNTTYAMNIGIEPVTVDLSDVSPKRLRNALGVTDAVDVLSACPPCTGFSRTNSRNHVVDDGRNGLVPAVAAFVAEFAPGVVVMENARELLMGNFRRHFEVLRGRLHGLGYTVTADVHVLTRFGLPQVRERAMIIATRDGLPTRTMEQVWHGYRVKGDALTVKHAIGSLPSLPAGETHPDDAAHVSPRFAAAHALQRMRAIPPDGGSWRDLIGSPATAAYLTPAMRKLIAAGRLGSHPDVYGRMAWDRPAPTIKRECGHVGNGRYAHPVDDRLCTLRELAVLNGFPSTYEFGGTGLANRYRHVGDAVPPLISHQIAWAVHWALTGRRPAMADIILPNTSLRPQDIAGVGEEAA